MLPTPQKKLLAWVGLLAVSLLTTVLSQWIFFLAHGPTPSHPRSLIHWLIGAFYAAVVIALALLAWLYRLYGQRWGRSFINWFTSKRGHPWQV